MKSRRIIYDRPQNSVQQSTLATSRSADPPRPAADAPPLRPSPPLWVHDAMPGLRGGASSSVDGVRSGPLVWLSTTIPRAGALDADTLRREVERAYVDLGRALAASGTAAIRIWNYLPEPTAPMGPGLDRYMVFNAGRHLGYRQWFTDDAFEAFVPTASAVGVPGIDLIVQCLASSEKGRAVQNPRQKPAWEYSARYGPVAPSFSRATIASVAGRELLLIGGTASIVGEDSVHIGDIAAQLDETLRNLAALIGAARQSPEPTERSLARLEDLRVYIARERDADAIRTTLLDRCAGTARIEMTEAPLCRRELLVEIEGIAILDA
jgi:chorismate lyase/3-hydroxybenzoate synthase